MRNNRWGSMLFGVDNWGLTLRISILINCVLTWFILHFGH